MRKQLDYLRDQTNADSLAEVIRRALAVYDTLRKASVEGATIVIETKDGERELLIPEFSTRATTD